ncbi:MAG: hypothetical protein JJU02_00945 [Cryomorphaceae bacterium]|nr:hypothetical protein [Cryomorphaceae bacterium]
MWLIDKDEFPRRWANIKALVFDWDGVFNSGMKSKSQPSGFYEADSMGVNMLRFSLWLRDEKLPVVAVITGADNPGALDWAQREHINTLYTKVLNKEKVLENFCQENGLQPQEVAFFFDDILDLNAAAISGLRMLVQRPGAEHFQNLLQEKGLVDYISHQTGGEFGLRECCDEILHRSDMLSTIVEKRMATEGDYHNYLLKRNLIDTKYLTNNP